MSDTEEHTSERSIHFQKHLNEAKCYLPNLERVLREVLNQRPDFFKKVGEDYAINFVKTSLDRVTELEAVALESRYHLNKYIAENVRAILVISAPGTYLEASKGDRYKDKSWSIWMDRRRLNKAAEVCRVLTELKIGKNITNNPDDFIHEISDNGPFILYSGRPDENDAVITALDMAGIIFPKSKVMLIGGEFIDNTVDQAQQLYIPEGVTLKPGDELGFIAHAPQVLRFLHSLQDVVEKNEKADSQGTPKPYPRFPLSNLGPVIRVFPLSTPQMYPDTFQKTMEYPIQEICGLVYYTFYADPHLASEKPYPYKC